MAALFAAFSISFSLNPPEANAAYARRWSYDATGLADGLGFAVEPDFCNKMMPQLEDRQFISCDYLQSAILRAFETWSINHQAISFVNVTETCLQEPEVAACMDYAVFMQEGEPGSGEGASGDAATYAGVDRGNCTKLCDRAQIYVLAERAVVMDEATNRNIAGAVSVGLWHSLGLDTYTMLSSSVAAPITTAGAVASRDQRISKATLTFNRAQCFYLDSTFCKGMHEMEAQGMSVLVIFSLIMMPCFACALVALFLRCCVSLHALRKREYGCPGTLYESIHEVTSPIWLTWLLLTIAIISPYVYFSIAAPCVRCYDFEATFVHSVGKALGLTDPSLAGSADYGFSRPLNSTNCVDEILYPPSDANSMIAARRTEFDAYVPTSVGEGPVMLTPSRKRAERCLSNDDLDGLNYLYPTCSLTRIADAGSGDFDVTPDVPGWPECVRSRANYGLLRFGAVVIVGIVTSFLVVAVLSVGTGWLLQRDRRLKPELYDQADHAQERIIEEAIREGPDLKEKPKRLSFKEKAEIAGKKAAERRKSKREAAAAKEEEKVAKEEAKAKAKEEAKEAKRKSKLGIADDPAAEDPDALAAVADPPEDAARLAGSPAPVVRVASADEAVVPAMARTPSATDHEAAPADTPLVRI